MFKGERELVNRPGCQFQIGLPGGPKSKPLPIFQKNRIKDCQRD